MSNNTETYTLYGAPFSLFTGKLRSYLINKQIPYREELSTLKVYKNIIIPKTGVRFIPVLKTPDGQYLQDTAVIIDHLEGVFTNDSVFPQSPGMNIIARLLEFYADEWLVIPAMHYRWNKGQEDYLYSAFGSVIAPGWPKFLAKFLGKKAGSKFRGFVPILGIDAKTIPAIEHWYEREFLPLLNELFKKQPYLLGESATIGDVGFMGSLYAHLYLDPKPGLLMKELAPEVCAWVERMNTAPAHERDPVVVQEPTQEIGRLLELLFRDFWPMVRSTVHVWNQWSSQNKKEEIPRTIGEHQFEIGGVQGSRAVMSFTVWKLQRVLDVYRSLAQTQQQTVTDLLSRYGGHGAFDVEIENPIARVNNRLVFADRH